MQLVSAMCFACTMGCATTSSISDLAWPEPGCPTVVLNPLGVNRPFTGWPTEMSGWENLPASRNCQVEIRGPFVSGRRLWLTIEGNAPRLGVQIFDNTDDGSPALGEGEIGLPRDIADPFRRLCESVVRGARMRGPNCRFFRMTCGVVYDFSAPVDIKGIRTGFIHGSTPDFFQRDAEEHTHPVAGLIYVSWLLSQATIASQQDRGRFLSLARAQISRWPEDWLAP